MSEVEVVFCYEEEPGRYAWFLHEADALLLSLARMVDGGALTADEAREEWKPYRAFWPDIYDEAEYGRSEFPDSDAVMDTLPASSGFWRTAVRSRHPRSGVLQRRQPGVRRVLRDPRIRRA